MRNSRTMTARVLDNILFHACVLTLSTLIYHGHLHPLQAANCCRNSRLVVEEDDLM